MNLFELYSLDRKAGTARLIAVTFLKKSAMKFVKEYDHPKLPNRFYIELNWYRER